MGMFDYYQPLNDYRCPVCQTVLLEWQGKDGPCGLFVWNQGTAYPVEQRVDEEIAIGEDDRKRLRLPSEFSIYSHDCDCPYGVTIQCECEKDIWVFCEVVTADNARQERHETKRAFKERLSWLKGRRKSCR